MMPVARDDRWTNDHHDDDARSGTSMGYQRRPHLSLVEPGRGVDVGDGRGDGADTV